jgi:hypothetical protein
MIRLLDAENRTWSVILGSQESFTVATVGTSTVIEPSPALKRKIDPHLLNLTQLVSTNHLENNQTNVILSIPSNIETLDTLSLDIVTRLCPTTGTSDRPAYFTATLNYSSLFRLAESPDVDYIWLNRKFHACLDESVAIVKDPQKWASFESYCQRSVNGSAVKLAILDTGVDASHPDFFFPNDTSKITAAVSFTGESSSDEHGHGTHCASVAAGTGVASAGQYVGMAPGAPIYNVKVLNNLGEGLESWIISGIQWAVERCGRSQHEFRKQHSKQRDRSTVCSSRLGNRTRQSVCRCGRQSWASLVRDH